MSRRFTDLSDPEWQRLFQDLRSSWFRLETLQAYDVEYEAEEFQAFLRTGRADQEPQDWQRMIAAHTRAGRHLQRVHVVQEPLTDYLRYEFTAYEHNARAGEEIRIIPVQNHQWPAGLPEQHDFWLFDDRDAWDMQYDPTGRFLGAKQSDRAEEIEQRRRWRDTALAQSMPLADYIRRAA